MKKLRLAILWGIATGMATAARGQDKPAAEGSMMRSAVSGVVLKADGSPASGVMANLATERQPIEIVNGVPRGTRPHPTTRAGADGSFRFPPQEEPGWVLVLEDSGFATATDKSLRDMPTMRLMAWGRVEGVVRSGPGVVPGAKITLSTTGEIAGRGSYRAVQTSDRTTASKDGTSRSTAFSQVVRN